MAAHYTRERSKYGTLTGSIIVWPVEFIAPSNPNNPDSISALPAGYLRCNGAKYNAKDYPNLASICGTGTDCKFQRFDENDDPIVELGEDEFLVPDLGSKYPRPVSGGDAGTYNNIIEQTQNNTYIYRSGVGVEITSNVGTVAEVTYSGKFVIPSQTITVKSKPSWTFGTAGYTDEESVDNRAIHPHLHFSTTNRVRVKPKSSATGGIITLPDIQIPVNDPSLNPTYSGTAFVGFGNGTGETGGFTNPNLGTSGYVAFGGTYSSTVQTTRQFTCTLDFENNYNLLQITSIMGNDSNGGERINNTGEGLYVIWPDGSTSSQPLIPSRGDSGLSQASWDTKYATWSTQTIPIPQQFRNQQNQTITIKQVLAAYAGELQPANDTAGNQNCYDMGGITKIGVSGGYTEDPNLTGGENDFTGGENYFFTASTINIQKWLNATSLENTPGKNQPACYLIASGNNPYGQPYSGSVQITWVFGFCLSGCDLNTLRCYCLLNASVSYALANDYFGAQGARYANYTALGCIPGNTGGAGAPVTESANAPATYYEGAQSVPIDFKGISLADVLPLNSNVTNEVSFPQAKNLITTVDEPALTGDPTAHNHKITFVKNDHTFQIVTDPLLLEPDALNTTVALTPSTVASIDAVTSPFIVLEYLIKT
jgi:hypothetical protein